MRGPTKRDGDGTSISIHMDLYESTNLILSRLAKPLMKILKTEWKKSVLKEKTGGGQTACLLKGGGRVGHKGSQLC